MDNFFVLLILQPPFILSYSDDFPKLTLWHNAQEMLKQALASSGN
jgi:hypothetical protein